MPLRKDKTPAPASEPEPEPLDKFLQQFKHLIKQWQAVSNFDIKINIHPLKGGKYIEEVPKEVVIEKEPEEIDMEVKYEQPPMTPKKEFSQQFTEEELQNLRLEDCGGVEVVTEPQINIGLGFNKEGILTKIWIEETELPTQFMEIFRVIKARYVTISKLHLVACNLKPADIIELGKFLRDYQCVQDVCLDGNNVSSQNFHLLIKQTGVEHLSLRHCKIDCFGAKMISKCLTFEYGVVHKLLTLNLNGNMIHDEGLVVLAQSLRSNCTLQCLSVANNVISDYGILEFTKVLQKFRLTRTEDLDRRFSYVKYLERVETKFHVGLGDDTHSIVTNISSLSDVNKGDTVTTKRKTRKSFKSTNIEGKDEEIFLASASDTSMADIFANHLNPLLALTCEENGVKYCVGNFSLQYLNLSYNWIGKAGLEALMKTVQYQADMGPQKSGPGLIYLDLEGLNSIEEVEVNDLKELLATRYVPPSLDKRHLF